MSTGINKRIAIGAGWMIMLRWADRLIGLVSIIILARLLLPADFGLVAYAMVFLAILEQFFLFSFETVLIRDQNATWEKYSTVWTLELIKGFVVSSIIVVSAESVAIFFDEPDVEEILYWISTVPILKGLVNIGVVDFQKDLEFNKEFYFRLSVRLAGSFLTIALALVLRSYWALVYGAIFSAVLRFVISYLICKFRPRPCLSEISRVLGFSIWLLVQNIFYGISTRLPALVIGRFYDAQARAFFNMADELTNQMTGQLAAPIRRALYPGVTKMQDDKSQMASTVTSALGIIVFLGLPASIGIGVTAPIFVPALLGSNWVGVAPIITVLSLLAAVRMFYPNSNVIFFAMNRPRITALISALQVGLLLPAIILVVPRYGAVGAGWALVVISTMVTIVDYFILIRLTAVELGRVISVVWRSVVAVSIMAYSVNSVMAHYMVSAHQDPPFFQLGVCVAVGIVSYVTSVSVLWKLFGSPPGAESYVYGVVRGFVRRKLVTGH